MTETSHPDPCSGIHEAFDSLEAAMARDNARRARPTFTDRPFVRSHGKQPRGTGAWAFQQTRTDLAFTGDLFGPIVWANGTLAAAKREAAASFPAGALVAVLP